MTIGNKINIRFEIRVNIGNYIDGSNKLNKLVQDCMLTKTETKNYCSALIEIIDQFLKTLMNNPTNFNNLIQILVSEYILFEKIMRGGNNLHILPKKSSDILNSYMGSKQYLTIDRYNSLVYELSCVITIGKDDLLAKFINNIKISKTKIDSFAILKKFIINNNIDEMYKDIVDSYETECLTLYKKQYTAFMDNITDIQKNNNKIEKKAPKNITIDRYLKEIISLNNKNFSKTRFFKFINLLFVTKFELTEEHILIGLIRILC